MDSPPTALARPKRSSSRRAGCHVSGTEVDSEVLALLEGTCRLNGVLECPFSDMGTLCCWGWCCLASGWLCAGRRVLGTVGCIAEALVGTECGRIMMGRIRRVECSDWGWVRIDVKPEAGMHSLRKEKS